MWISQVGDFLTSGFGTTLVALLAFVAGTVFKSFTDAYVRKKSDTQVEGLKSELRIKELHLANQIKSVDELSHRIGNQVLTMRSSRVNTIEQKRVDALLALWGYSVDAAPMHAAARFAERINFEAAIVIASKDDEEAHNTRKFAEGIWKMSGLENAKHDALIDKVRPLVPAITWAYFSAYRAALTQPVAQLGALKFGLKASLLANPKPTLDMIKSILPHYSKLFDEHGVSFIPHIVEELRDKLLVEIERALNDTGRENQEIERAKEILSAVAKVEAIQSSVN